MIENNNNNNNYSYINRESLNENWGIYDVEDCVSAAYHLIDKGIAHPGKTVIMGGSAGGFTTLLALSKYRKYISLLYLPILSIYRRN